MLVELMPEGGVELGSDVAQLDFSYRVPGTDTVVTQQIDVSTPQPGFSEPWFANDAVEKGFVMLNLYVGFRMAAEDASSGNDLRALGVLESLRLNVQDWLGDNPDDDISDDLQYVDRFIENLTLRTSDPRRPETNREPWLFD